MVLLLAGEDVIIEVVCWMEWRWRDEETSRYLTDEKRENTH